MLMSVLILLAGFALLYFGGEYLVKGSSSLALQLGVTPLLVGLTVVAFGTSSPEMAVSVKAGLSGVGDVALGNVVGSNIFNILGILGIAALVQPMVVKAQIIQVDSPIMIGVSLLLCFFYRDGMLSRAEGIGLFLGIIVYVIFSIRLARKEKQEVKDEFAEGIQEDHQPLWVNLLFIGGGLVALVFGGRFFVDGSVAIARSLGVTEAVIGLTIVAIGTSMPELATSLIASMKKEGDIAIGNIVGSNIFNILAILGITAMLQPLAMGNITWTDMVVMVVTAVVLVPIMRTGFTISRAEGAVMLVAYVGYVVYLIGQQP